MTQLATTSYHRMKIAAALCAIATLFLACVPLHGIDDLLLAPFFDGKAFPLHGSAAVEFLHSYAGKIPPVLAGLWFIRIAVRPGAIAPFNGVSARSAALCALGAMLASIALVSLLKKLTGMDCPWDLAIYGGSAEHSTPLYEMLHGNFSGHCWPSGYSGGIFSAYAWCLYLCLRGKAPSLVKLSFALITLLGLLGGVLQMARGAHFPTHVIAAMTLDYALCFALMSPLLRRAALQAPGKAGEEERA
ncbi:MAG: phosphatase PAP2 family protein [Succinivibrio sp.]